MLDNDKIASKVAKLLALAKGNTTEGEADAAMAMAQGLMREHNLSMATIEAKGGEKEGRVREYANRSLMYKWKRELLEAIAKANFCVLVIRKTQTAAGESLSSGYDVIGRKSNAVAVSQMFEYLTSSIERILVQEVGTSPQARYNRWSHSFRQGCSERLAERLAARHREQMAKQSRQARDFNAASTAGALVVVLEDFAQNEADANNDVQHGLPPGTTAKARQERNNRWAEQDAKRKATKEAARIAHPGQPDRIYELMSYGYSFGEALEEFAKEQKEETPAQKRKREEQSQRYWEKYDRQQERKTAYKRSAGFQRGKARADDIGLDEQVDDKAPDRKALG